MANTGQVTRDLNLIASVLERITQNSTGTAKQLKILIDTLERVTATETLDQFHRLSGSMELFVKTLTVAGAEVGYFENQLKIDGLEKRDTTYGGIVPLLQKMGREGEVTNKVIEKLVLSAKIWRAEVKKLRSALQELQNLGEGKGKDPVDSALTDSGSQQQDTNIGQSVREQRELYETILPGGKVAIDNVEKSLKKMGLTLDDVSDIHEDGAQNITRWTASLEIEAGLTKRATITTNQYGQILKSTSRNLKTFGAGIVSNIAKVAQWTVAIAIVYAPMRLLNDLTEQAVEIESKLADVQIGLATGQESLNKVWEESTNVAKELGIGVEGVIDGYVLAVRATANIIDPTEKAAATTAILKDSMILAKLAGIDQAVAMDTLVGALRQLGIPLTEGADLVDKWVAVSKAANVSLHTLAESFAITATAAENVGLSMDELNGFIAAVAEVTTLSATESGNAVRAFISGFQTDQAERELNKFGISVRDVNGELKAFSTVIDDIVERKDIGLISDKELAKISEIIGGGARRGAQVNAFLENYSRVQELAAVSANASGDAADAMAIKIGTLKSALENLNTAFSELARAFGTDGGFLDLVRSGAENMLHLVEAVTKVVKILGNATPAIIAFAAAWQYLRKSTQAQAILGTEMSDILMGGDDPERKFRRAREFLSLQAKMRGVGTAKETITGVGGALGGGVGGAGIGLGVALAAGNADLKRAGTTMGGAAISQIMAGGSPVGGLIGASIVTAIWSNLVDREADLTAAWTRIFTGAYDETANVVEDEKEPGDVFKEVKDLIGGQDIGGLITGLGGAALAFATPGGSIMDVLKPSQEDIENATVSIMDSIIAVAEDRATVDQAIITGMFWNKSEIDAMYPEVLAAMKEIQQKAADDLESSQPGRAGKPFGLRLLGITDDIGDEASAVVSDARERILQEVAQGDTGVRELTEFLKLGNFEIQLGTIIAGLTSLGKATGDVSEIAETLINASEQEGLIFERLANDIGVLENEYRALEASYEGYIDAAGRMELQQMEADIRDLQGVLDEYLTVAGEGQQYQAFQAPTLVGISPDASRRQMRQIVQEARELTKDYLDSLELEGPERQKVIDSFGELALQNVETYKVGMQGITDVMPEILDDLLEQADIAGKQVQDAMGFQQVDLEAAQLPQLYGNIQYYQDLLEPTGVLETQDLEDIVLLTSDKQTDAITTYGILLNLALQDLIAIEEQQLEGIFNIPEGVTAQIPFTGKLYFSDQPIPTAGGGGIEKLGDAVDSLTGEAGKGLTLSQQQIDALQALLIISGGSETFLQNIEGLLREAGVEPEERGEPKEPVTLAEALAPEPVSTEQATLMAEAFAGALSQSEQVNPELRLHRRFQEGGGFTQPEEGGMEAGFGGEFWGDAADAFSGAISGTFQELFDTFLSVFGIDVSGEGGTGGISSEQVLAALPQSIPVNIQTRITNPVSVLLDGYQIAQSLNERNYEDLQSATRRQGAVGYIMEA